MREKLEFSCKMNVSSCSYHPFGCEQRSECMVYSSDSERVERCLQALLSFREMDLCLLFPSCFYDTRKHEVIFQILAHPVKNVLRSGDPGR